MLVRIGSTMRHRSQLTVGVMMLWIACCAVGCWNLKILAVDLREDVVHIWKDWTGTHRIAPTQLRWSNDPAPPLR
jgi:hypothetical protein